MDQKHLESFEMWCCRRMEKISWTDHVRNEEVLLRVKEQRNMLHEIWKQKAKWIGHILRKDCLLQRVTEGKIQKRIEVTGIQRRRRAKLLDDLKERRGYSYLKEEALDRTIWRARFGRGFGPVVRHTTKWMNTVAFCWIFFGNYFMRWYWQNGARGGAVGWGTALQVGRSRLRFPMVSLEFFIDIILPAALWPWGWLSL